MKLSWRWFRRDGENYLFFERDGDFNPTWIFVGVYVVLGVYACWVALGTKQQLAIVAALSFLATIIVALLVSALPISKAKVLAASSAPGDAGRSVSQAASGMGWPDDGIRPPGKDEPGE